MGWFRLHVPPNENVLDLIVELGQVLDEQSTMVGNRWIEVKNPEVIRMIRECQNRP